MLVFCRVQALGIYIATHFNTVSQKEQSLFFASGRTPSLNRDGRDDLHKIVVIFACNRKKERSLNQPIFLTSTTLSQARRALADNARELLGISGIEALHCCPVVGLAAFKEALVSCALFPVSVEKGTARLSCQWPCLCPLPGFPR